MTGQQLADESGGKLARGYVYVILMHLCDFGYVTYTQEKRREPPYLPCNRYALTKAGAAWLDYDKHKHDSMRPKSERVARGASAAVMLLSLCLLALVYIDDGMFLHRAMGVILAIVCATVAFRINRS